MYRVLTLFIDLPTGTKYHKGDIYPCENVPKERLKELSSDKNARKRPLIEKVVEKKAKK